jgi:tetratricopeptide (TPR) repeat protein
VSDDPIRSRRVSVDLRGAARHLSGRAIQAAALMAPLVVLGVVAGCGDATQPVESRPAAMSKSHLPPPVPLPPGGRHAQAEHAVGQAGRFVEAGDLVAASQALDDALVLDPMNRRALIVRGRILLAEQRPSEALTSFEEARAMRADVSVHEWIGLAYLALRNERLAATDDSADEPRPEDLAESARMAFLEVVRLDPDSGNGRHNLGYCCRLTGRFDESVEILQALVAEQPERARTLYELGVSLRAADRDEEARETFRRLLGIQPEHGAARLALQDLGG